MAKLGHTVKLMVRPRARLRDMLRLRVGMRYSPIASSKHQIMLGSGLNAMTAAVQSSLLRLGPF